MNRNKSTINAKSSSKSSVIGTFTGKCCDYTVFNNNTMKLSRELFENLFASEEYKRAIELRHYIGFLGHPEDPGCMDFEHACIIMTECHIEENGDVIGTFDLIDTPVGRIVKAFIDAGVIWGISIRGAGDVDGEGNVDPETFVFRGFDIVTFPAYNDAVPVFQEIAASSDLDAQVKYKKVCSTVKKNLQAITSSEALDIIQAQFNPDSNEYSELEARKAEIQQDDDSSESDIQEQKLEGMTQLYLKEVEATTALKAEVAALKQEVASTRVECRRKIRAIERITSSQAADLSKKLDKVTASYRTSVAANSRLKDELEAATNTNLKYTHKIEANSQTICQKDSTISKLERELSETVTAGTRLERRASNLDEKCKNLTARVEAAEQMVLKYQQAYANMYANALGVRLENLPISASTSVEELRQMISGGTSTCNIGAAPAVMEPIELPMGNEDDSDIVTL